MTRTGPDAGTLNPFALPPETNARVLLVVATAVLIAANLGTLVALLSQQRSGNHWMTPESAPKSSSDGSMERAAAVSRADSVYAARSLVLPLLMAAGLLILTAAIYRTHPRRVDRWGNARPAPPDEAREVQTAVDELSRAVGLSPPPAVHLVGKLRTTGDAQAYGIRGHYRLRLGRGLRLVYRKNPREFNATALHEMAHLANADVGRTYVAEGAWYAGLMLGVLPLAGVVLTRLMILLAHHDATAGFGTRLLDTFVFAAQVAAMFAVLAATRASVLRIREFYADVRAKLWGAGRELVATLRTASSVAESDPVRRSPWRRLTGPWRLHPDAAERLAHLEDPGRLFSVRPDMPFLVGILLFLLTVTSCQLAVPALMTSGAYDPAAVRLGPGGNPDHSFWLLVGLTLVAFAGGLAYLLAIGTFPAATLGSQVGRQAMAELAFHAIRPPRHLGLFTIAVLTGCGSLVGFIMYPIRQMSVATVAGAALAVLSFAEVVLVVWLALWSTRVLWRLIVGNHLGQSPPLWKRRMLTLFTSGMMGAANAPIFVAFYVAQEELPPPAHTIFLMTSVCGGSAAVMLIILGLGAIVGSLVAGLQDARCCGCGRAAHGRPRVGALCIYCGCQLAPWIFVPSVPPPLPQRCLPTAALEMPPPLPHVSHGEVRH